MYPRWIAAGTLSASLAYERQHRIDDAAKILKQVVLTLRVPYQPGLDFSGASVVAGPTEG